ncbi:hypothetical protein ADL02_32095 [Streptomyces sp. NRRL WC-3723]|nr:hypothetical protein ADL02_32095 [Streptomyces sp. NRRL WC-3723]
MPLVHFLVPLRNVLLELAVRWRDHTPAGLRAQALVVGVGEYLDWRPVGQELDQHRLTAVGVDRTAAGSGWAANSRRPFSSVTTMVLTASVSLGLGDN